jgi:pilus assembly protein CpaB
MAVDAPRLEPISIGRPPRRRRVSPVGRRVAAAVVAAIVAGVAFLVVTADRAGTQVAVAARDIQAGQVFEDSLVRYVDVRVPASVRSRLVATAQVAGLRGQAALRPIAKGSLVEATDFAPPNAGPARQAMSFPVEIERAMGGALRPGDRVDVIDGVASNNTQPSYALVGAEVVAVREGSGGGLGATGKYWITVTVDSDGALRLAAAVAHGAVSLVRTAGPSTAVAAPAPTTTPARPGPPTTVAGQR